MIQLNIPTKLTFFRIILIPFFVLFFYIPFDCSTLICVLLFIVAALTDWFDGFLARRWRETTKFGEILDPVADKIMIVTALILVIEYYHTLWVTLPAVTMILREVVISSLREWMAEIGKRSYVAVSWIGKIKTVAQVMSLTVMLWHPNIIINLIGIVLLYFAVILTFWSMFGYISIVWKILMKLGGNN